MSDYNLQKAHKDCSAVYNKILAATYEADKKLKPILDLLWQEAKSMCEYYSEAAIAQIERDSKHTEQMTKNRIWVKAISPEMQELKEAADMELSAKLAGFYRRRINRIIEELDKLGVKEPDLFSEPKTILPKPRENPQEKEYGKAYLDQIQKDLRDKE